MLANLANFAYDPINYDHFRKLNILDLFLDVVAEEMDEKMIEYAMGGICNCCLDPANMKYLVENDGVELSVKCLGSGNEETVLSAITTLIYITTPETKKGRSLILPPSPPLSLPVLWCSEPIFLQIQLLTILLNWWENLLTRQINVLATWPLFSFKTVAVTLCAQWVELQGKPPPRDDVELWKWKFTNIIIKTTSAKHMYTVALHY